VPLVFQILPHDSGRLIVCVLSGAAWVRAQRASLRLA
jgi:hypothetical protein